MSCQADEEPATGSDPVGTSNPDVSTANDPLARLHVAIEERDALRARYDAYEGNNPDRHRVPLQRAQETVDRLERSCRRLGLLPGSEHDVLEAELDAEFPKAENGQIVQARGRWYQRRFSVGSVSRNRNPTSWVARWDELSEADPKVRRLLEPPEFMSYRAALAKVWPFDHPAGGLEFDVALGEPDLQVARGRRAISWDKGRPSLRTSLRVSLCLNLEAWDLIVRCAASPASRSALMSGKSLIVQQSDGLQWQIEKTGRKVEDLQLVPTTLSSNAGDSAAEPTER
jgi:hypothetical protein